jgi:hypothetical protein
MACSNVVAPVLAGAFTFFALTSAEAATRHMVEVVKTMEVTTQAGRKINLDVVEMNGHMMVLVPEDAVPDFFHQKIFKKEP